MNDYPEHAKLSQVQPQTQAIGEFLDWVASKHGAHLMTYVDVDDFRGWVPAGVPITRLLAEWAGIDEDKIESEKRAMLADIRARYNSPEG